MDILDEIKEDLRTEKARQFWTNYGKQIFAAIGVLVLGTGLWSGLQQYNHHRALGDSEKFSAAVQMAEDQNRNEALAELTKIAAVAGPGYKTLALFSEASLQQKAGDTKAAIASYDTLANNAGLDPLYRELAIVYSASLQLDMSATDFDALFDRLQPLTATGKSWRYSALELQGLARWQQGKTSDAKEIFGRLAADPQAPDALKVRAERWASQLVS